METINSDATHPLSNLDEQITQASTRQGDYDFGAHFYGYGKGIVKGGNLSFYRRQEEGKEFVELEFKVNNYALPHLRQCATQNTKLHSDQPLTTEETNQLL
ncbi:MAG: hypothetical protein KDK63_00050, partial [Chlamydiia bacterium]|nr:hypothetical protein [Chlamydiia bacterium]